MASKTLINLSNLQKFLLKLNEKFALKKTMKGISEDSEGNIIIGEEGLVPTPNENSKGKFLRSDGEWALPSETAVYDSMRIEEGVAGVSEVDKVLNAKNLKQIVNSDGFLTSLDSSKLTGVINIENLPQGALERILIVSSKEERLTLSDAEVQLGDVVKESDTGLMYYVINTEKLNSEEGYTQFTAGMASSVPWSGVTDKPTIPTKTSDLTNDSDFVIDSNVVHKSGDETVNGTKMFSNAIHRYADLATNTVEQVYRFDDTNANTCGHIYNNVHRHNNALYNRHGSYNAKSGKSFEIDITSDDSGVGMAYVSGTATNGNLETVTSTGYYAIATMGWVNNPATSTNVVHRSGDEYINGNKIFSNTIHRYADLTTSGGVQVYRFVDTNANGCGHIFNNAYWTGDVIHNAHGVHNAKSGKLMQIGITSNDAGVGMAYIDGSATNGNLETVTSITEHNGIATMGWVNNPATSTNVVHRSGDENIAGNKLFGDKIICTRFTHYTNNSHIYLAGGSEYDKGATLVLHGEESNDAGSFVISSRDKTRTLYLVGKPDGTLQWAGQDIATTAWVRNYVNSVRSYSMRSNAMGSNEVGSSIAAYYSNATTLTAEGSSSSSGGSYPSDYSDYIDISPTEGTIYTGSQLFSTLNASASGSKNTSNSDSESTNYQTTAKATANFSGAFSSSAKYLCTTANAVRFRAFVSQGTTSDIGTASVSDNSSARSIFTRIE